MAMTSAERQKAYRERHPERVKKANKEQMDRRSSDGYHRDRYWRDPSLPRRYATAQRCGVSYQELLDFLEGREAVCEICGMDEDTHRQKWSDRGLCVDHCHDTGKLRGLLCSDCNLLLGRADDSIDRLKWAIAYLEKNQ